MASPKEVIKVATGDVSNTRYKVSKVDVFHIKNLGDKPRSMRENAVINNKNIVVIKKKFNKKKQEVFWIDESLPFAC